MLFYLFVFGGSLLGGGCSLGRLRACLTLAEISLLTCRALLSQHQLKLIQANLPWLVSWSFVSRLNVGVKDEGDTGGSWGRSAPKACQALAEGVWKGKIGVS